MSISAQQLYEQTLIVRSQIGDEEAFRELLSIYSPRLLSFLRKLLSGSPDRAEDLLQESWVRIFRGLPGLLDVTKFAPWAFRIVRDRAYADLRRRHLPVEALDDHDAGNVPETSEPEPIIDAAELRQCLDSLTVGHREVLILRFFEEMDYEDIARITSNNIGTVRSRIHYAKRALRHAVEKMIYEH